MTIARLDRSIRFCVIMVTIKNNMHIYTKKGCGKQWETI